MNSRTKQTLALVAIALLAACEKAPTPEVATYKEYTDIERKNVTVQVVFLDEPTRYCETVVGTLRNEKSEYLGCSTYIKSKNKCDIVMRKPTNFNDDLHMEVLGHELMHCLGANHE
jgi:hypothetical protein